MLFAIASFVQDVLEKAREQSSAKLDSRPGGNRSSRGSRPPRDFPRLQNRPGAVARTTRMRTRLTGPGEPRGTGLHARRIGGGRRVGTLTLSASCFITVFLVFLAVTVLIPSYLRFYCVWVLERDEEEARWRFFYGG